MKRITQLLLLLLILSGCASTKKVSTPTFTPTVLTEEEQLSFTFNFYEGLRLKEEGMYADAMESFLISK